MIDNNDPYLTLEEIALLFNVSIYTIYKWRKNSSFGNLNFVKIKGSRGFYIKKSEILKYISDHLENRTNIDFQQHNGDRFLSRIELAKRLRIRAQTLANWEWNKNPYAVPVIKLICGKPRYRIEDVEKWLSGLFCNYSKIEEFTPHIDLMDEKLLTGKETMSILNVTPGMFFSWKYRRKYFLPFIKIGRINLYRPSDVRRCKEMLDKQRLKHG